MGKIPEAVEKHKIESIYKLERIKKLETIKEKLAKKIEELRTEINYG